ncbi:hypothetical protein AMECASPLE_002854 [Ameca splendens]|uniref:Uncharacterized protein n=1 Tax=Ameca splendens TaxID=208324 RepID=A0ABV0Z880_9TELE
MLCQDSAQVVKLQHRLFCFCANSLLPPARTTVSSVCIHTLKRNTSTLTAFAFWGSLHIFPKFTTKPKVILHKYCMHLTMQGGFVLNSTKQGFNLNNSTSRFLCTRYQQTQKLLLQKLLLQKLA